MKKRWVKSLSCVGLVWLLVFVLAACPNNQPITIPCTTPPPQRVIFGEYPQTLATSEALEQMSDTSDFSGYYTSAYDNERYAKIAAMPYASHYEFHDGSNIYGGNEFYFKVEPIIWRVLDINNNEALLLSEVVLDTHLFSTTDHNWETSAVRAWLNNDFFNDAFYPIHQAQINNTPLDNQTTGYWASTQNNTTDQVFLLSYDDVINDNYRFHPVYQNFDCERIGNATDYALATGVQVKTVTPEYGDAFWTVRSPGGDNDKHTYINQHGAVFFDSPVTNVAMGMRPSIVVKDITQLDVYSARDIYFGRYPQTVASNEALADMSTEPGPDGYYYSLYDGERYVKLKATPFTSGYLFSNNQIVHSGEEYYFKLEPIKWRILESLPATYLLMTEVLLDVHRYDEHSNHWAKSEIRTWLNQYFYNNAFSNLEKNLINLVSLDNQNTSNWQTPQIQDPTDDKIFHLSYDDLTNSLFSFNPDFTFEDISRRAVSTDYAMARGIYIHPGPDPNSIGNSYWMLRSPGSTYDYYHVTVAPNGIMTPFSYVYGESNGVRPAIRIDK